MRRLVCTCIVCKPLKTGFLALKPINEPVHDVMVLGTWHEVQFLVQTFYGFGEIAQIPRLLLMCWLKFYEFTMNSKVQNKHNFHIYQTYKFKLKLYEFTLNAKVQHKDDTLPITNKNSDSNLWTCYEYKSAPWTYFPYYTWNFIQATQT